MFYHGRWTLRITPASRGKMAAKCRAPGNFAGPKVDTHTHSLSLFLSLALYISMYSYLGACNKSQALIKTPNSRALFIRISMDRTPNLQKQAFIYCVYLFPRKCSSCVHIVAKAHTQTRRCSTTSTHRCMCVAVSGNVYMCTRVCLYVYAYESLVEM